MGNSKEANSVVQVRNNGGLEQPGNKGGDDSQFLGIF